MLKVFILRLWESSLYLVLFDCQWLSFWIHQLVEFCKLLKNHHLLQSWDLDLLHQWTLGPFQTDPWGIFCSHDALIFLQALTLCRSQKHLKQVFFNPLNKRVICLPARARIAVGLVLIWTSNTNKNSISIFIKKNYFHSIQKGIINFKRREFVVKIYSLNSVYLMLLCKLLLFRALSTNLYSHAVPN